MKALIYIGDETLSYQDVPVSEAANGEILVKVESAGICGSDMHAFLGHDPRRPAPLILGHEAAGIVVGGEFDGERVTINPLVTCGECLSCHTGRENLCPNRQIISMVPRPGAFAEYVTIPRDNIIIVPGSVPLTHAALTEPVACGWHAIRLAIGVLKDQHPQKALVIGGGAVGVGAALSLQAQAVKDVTLIEPNALRRSYLQKTQSYRVSAQEEITENSFDIVVDAVGIEQTRMLASNRVRPGGVISHIGLGSDAAGLDIRRMTLQEITFIGTYTYTKQDFRDTADAIFDGRLGVLDWFEERPLAEGAAAFEAIRSGKTAVPKIILKP